MSITDMTVELMIFEGGALVSALPSNATCEALAKKIADSDAEALEQGQSSFTLTLNPIEIGIGLEAASRGSSPLSQAIAQKFRAVLEAKMSELGISYSQNQPDGGLNSLAPESQPTPEDDSGALNAPADTQNQDEDGEQLGDEGAE